VGFTTGRELHPAPKVEYSVKGIILQNPQVFGWALKIPLKDMDMVGGFAPPNITAYNFLR
jgi:hypothetical protein